jgi:hypothetical protein
MQLFVLGMHRSGTSGVTRLLNMSGAYFGPEGMSNGADDGNPKGFWERRDVRAVCNGLLKESGFDWYRVAGFSLDRIPEEVREKYVTDFQKILLNLDAYRPWAIKEPRLSLLFPLMREYLELPVCIHVTREPLEVAASLERRNGFPQSAGIALWEVYTLAAFAASEGLPRILVRYEDLMATPFETTARLIAELQELGTHSLRTPDEREVTAFITPELHRARRSADERQEWLTEPQRRLAAAIDDGSVLEGNGLRDRPTAGALGALETFERLQRACSDAERTTARAGELQAELNDAIEQLAQLEGDLVKVREYAAKLEGQYSRTEAEREAERKAHRRAQADAERALRSADRDIRKFTGSRSWKVAHTLSSVASRGNRDKPVPGPLGKALEDIRRSREALERPDGD